MVIHEPTTTEDITNGTRRPSSAYHGQEVTTTTNDGHSPLPPGVPRESRLPYASLASLSASLPLNPLAPISDLRICFKTKGAESM